MASKRRRQMDAERVTITDLEGRQRIVLAADNPDFHPHISMYDANGVERLQLALLADGEPRISFRSAEGVARVTMGKGPGGGLGIHITTPQGRTGFLVEVGDDGALRIVVQGTTIVVPVGSRTTMSDPPT